jgi:N-acetylmuramoyl-L-alanine amidase
MIGLFPMLAFFVPENDPHVIDKVILDAGHGGKDPGNLGTGRYRDTEKNVALDVTLLLGKYIEENLPGVEVVYTRDSDVFLELYERTAIANREKGDLFISIHLNAFTSPHSHGSETYTIGMHKTDAQLAVAQKENSVILMEENYDEIYKGFDPADPNTYVALSLMQGAYSDQSLMLAEMIQRQFRERVKRRDRGVKQAGFYVISRTVMPSVLVELGFLTNASEEDFLNSQVGKEYMASAIYRAVRDFKDFRESNTGRKSTTEKPKEEEEDDIPADSEEPVVEEEPVELPDAEVANELLFSVQFMSSPNLVALQPYNFNGLIDVEYYIESGSYKYIYGKTKDLEEARKWRSMVVEKGYSDAFIVSFYNGERIPITEALKMLEN